jgi:hypothetical protein
LFYSLPLPIILPIVNMHRHYSLQSVVAAMMPLGPILALVGLVDSRFWMLLVSHWMPGRISPLAVGPVSHWMLARISPLVAVGPVSHWMQART